MKRAVKRLSSFPHVSRKIRSTVVRRHHGYHGHHHAPKVAVSLGFGFHKTYVEPAYAPAPVVVGAPVISEPYPVGGQPVITPQGPAPGATPAPAGNVLFEGVVSREDDIAPKEILTIDGIAVKVEDTDDDPLDADIDIDVDHYEEEFEDVPIGASIPVIGLSGQTYYLHLFDIHDETETISFAIVQ